MEKMTQPSLIVLDNPQDIRTLKTYLEDKEYAAYDTETTGLSARDQVIGLSICASEDEAYYVILAAWDVENQKVILFEENIAAAKEILEVLQSKALIMHNGMFDCMMTESNFKISLIESLHTDTMVLAHLLNENRLIGLKPLGAEYFGEAATDEKVEMDASIIANGGKAGKSEYELYKADPYLIGRYGAKDAWLTFMLFHKLLPELVEQGLETFFYEDESMPLLRGPTYHLNTTGLKVDVPRLTSLKKQLEAECLEAEYFINTEIASHIAEKYPGDKKKTTFNIGSSQQLAWLLFGQLGLPFKSLTDGGKEILKHFGLKGPYTRVAQRDFISTCLNNKGQTYVGEVKGHKKAKKVKDPWAYISCDNEALEAIKDKYKWIEVLLEYQGKQKILSTYVDGFLNRMQYGVLNPSFNQTGTPGGRYSSSNPNFQNLPSGEKRVKECIIARPGKAFVGGDQSQLEPRIFAYYSGDNRLMAAFDGTSDFYSVIGIGVYGKYDALPLKEGHPDAFGVKYKSLRDLSKVIGLARAYGASAWQLASSTGKSEVDTQHDLDLYDENFPGVKKMMIDAHDLVKANGFVTNIFGRKRRLPEAMAIPKLYGKKTPHEDLPYKARNILNMACNHRIQSTGASIVNRASIRFLDLCKQAEIDVRLVVQVHDSLVAECNEADAEAVAALLQEAMENTVQLKGIRFEAIPRIGRNLAEV